VKPDAAIFALALERFELDAGEALFIDDLESNVRAAETSGLIGHHFRDALALRSELETFGLLKSA
jgi:2-haloacid dehalogenase